MRKIILAGNWKMYKTQTETLDFVEKFKLEVDEAPAEREVVLCVPFTDLAILSKTLHGSRIQVGAQNVHWEDCGPFTGEISAAMLTEVGTRYVVIAHSERRQYFGETDKTVNFRLRAAQKAGLMPILCIGETKEQRNAGEAEAIIFKQLEKGLAGVDQSQLVIAYEPIWAIGTGDTCASEEANRVISLIRSKLNNKDVPIQYGGSVKPENINEIMAQPEIDGVLVGGASLDPKGFAQIVNYQA